MSYTVFPSELTHTNPRRPIYFDKETKQEILNKVRRLLKPDGYLFLGAAETTLNLDDAFHREQIGKAVC